MKIDKYEKIGKSKYRIYLSTGEVLNTYDNVILKEDLLLKKEINDNDYNKIISKTEEEEAYNIAYKYILIRKRSTKEINNYLKSKQVDDNLIENIINRLTKENLLNDKAFAKAYIKDKIKFTTRGEYKIKEELKKLGITQDIIDECSYLFNDPLVTDKITKQIEKYLSQNHKLEGRELKNKIYNKLVISGYPKTQVIDLLNKYID